MGLVFMSDWVLWFLLLVPPLVYIYIRARRKKKKAAMSFSSIAFLRKYKNRHWLRSNISFILIILVVVLLILALADPHLPLKRTKKGVNLVMAIDISGSMLADDYKPTRMDAAKRSAEVLLENLEPKDHAGIVVFEQGATTAAYMSPFKDKVINKLRNIKAKKGKTAIGDGLSLAIDMATSIPNKKKVAILLSDGVNNAGVVSPKEAIEFAQANDIKVFTIGMGSEGKVVLGYDWFGNPQYAELDEKTLRAIAQDTGGQYFKSVDSETLEDIYSQLSKKIDREKENTPVKNHLIVMAIILLMAEFYIRYGRKRIIQ